MTVVSVINYKGGVGKTTLTANIGAELASRGMKILLIDLDPQASLTFSFYLPKYWEDELASEHTLLQWYGSIVERTSSKPLYDYVLSPPDVNNLISANGEGRLDLLSSHLGLLDVDLDFAYALGGSRFQHGSPDYLRLYRSLADALGAKEFNQYNVILIDCAPNFTMVTRTGIVASDYLLIPAPKAGRPVKAVAKRAPSKVREPVAVDQARSDLSKIDDRTAAAQYVKDLGLTVPELRALAKDLGISVASKATGPVTTAAIVQWTVGRRLDSDAVSRPAPSTF